jgi:protein involved in ribonucleotide reduction
MYFSSTTKLVMKIINKVYTFTIHIQIDVKEQHTDMGSEYLYTKLNRTLYITDILCHDVTEKTGQMLDMLH